MAFAKRENFWTIRRVGKDGYAIGVPGSNQWISGKGNMLVNKKNPGIN